MGFECLDAQGRRKGIGTTGPAGATGAPGSLTLLESYTASASATIDFKTRNASGQSGASFQSDFDHYVLKILNFIPATDNVDLLLRASTDGGSTFDVGSNYDYADYVNNTGAFSTNAVSGAAATSSKIIPTQDNSTTNGGACASIEIINPLSASLHKQMFGNVCWWNNDSQFYNGVLAFRYRSVTPVNALRLLYSSGNVASGIARLYGIAK